MTSQIQGNVTEEIPSCIWNDTCMVNNIFPPAPLQTMNKMEMRGMLS